MEGQLQAKDSTSTAAESVKSEGVLQSSDSSERSEGAASPPPNCSICLGKLINTSFTDSCLHQFCFTCLLQWSKIKTECPLCKQTFKSIIHNVRSEEDYDQYHVPRELASQISQPPVMAIQHLDVNFEVDENWDVGLRRFFYRTTMTDNRRRGMVSNTDHVTREQLPALQSQISREDHRYRRMNPTDYRRAIYTHGIWATSLPDVFGRFRECSAEYYRRHPRELDRLVPWLNRELQILINNRPAHIPYVLRTIMEALTRHDIRGPQFRSIVRPYCGVHTEHFIHELLNFARTNFDVVGYDQAVTYLFQGLSREYVPHVVSPVSSRSSTSSDDSDVRVLDEAIDLRVNAELPGIGPHPVNMPGPSTVGQAFQLEIPYSVPDVLTISSGSSDDECEVICYVKPRHERTPEIIELDSSDPEDINMPYTSNDNTECMRTSLYEDVPQASTSFNSKKGSWNKVYNAILRTNLSETSSSSNDDFSDSDYNPRRSRQGRSHVKKSSKKKINSKRRKRSNAKSRKRVDRSVSSSGESDFKNKSSRKTSQRGKIKLCTSSESGVEEDRKKKINEVKSRKETNSNRGTVHVRKDLIKKEDRQNQEDTVLNNDNSISTNSSNISGTARSSNSSASNSSHNSTSNSNSSSSSSSISSSSSSNSSSSSSSSSSNSSSSSSSSSETYNESKESHKCEAQQKSRTKCSTSSRANNAERTEIPNKDKGKTRLMTNSISLDDSNRKCYKYKDSKRSRTRSSSESSHVQQRGKRLNCKKRQARKHRSEYDSKEDNSIGITPPKRESSVCSSSRCSNYSDKSYKHRRRSKHMDSCKDKKRKRSCSRSYGRSRSGSHSISRSRSDSRSSNSSVTDSVMSTSSKSEICSASKHSDSKNNLSNKEKHRLHKSHKKSKHRRSRSKSRSKKKKRRIRLSYSSNDTN